MSNATGNGDDWPGFPRAFVNLCHNVEVGKGILGFERASDVNFVIA
jgi:hypothetical protein